MNAIELVFENCETLMIPASYVLDLTLQDVTKSYYLTSGGKLQEVNTFNTGSLTLSSKMKGEVVNTFDNGYERCIEHDDITQINVIGDVVQRFRPAWKEDWFHSGDNAFQSHIETDDSVEIRFHSN